MRPWLKPFAFRPALWGVFGLFVAMPALVLTWYGVRAISADAAERERQRGDQLDEVANLADAAIASALERHRASAAAQSVPLDLPVFEVDENGTIAFPGQRVYFGRFGAIPTAATASSTSTGEWTAYETARAGWRAGDVAVHAVAARSWSESTSFSPSGVPLAVVASSVSSTAPASDHAAFVPLIETTLSRLRDGAWWLGIDQRRVYDGELRRLLTAAGRPAPAEDARLAELARIEALVRPIASVGRGVDVIDTGSGAGLVLWASTTVGPVRRGLFLDPRSIPSLLSGNLDLLLARQSTDGEVVDQNGSRIWAASGELDRPASSRALSAVPGWRIRVAARPNAAAGQRSWQAYGLVLLPIAVLALGLVMMTRLVRREVALARRQAEFTAAVTHEFKSPITSLRLLVERISSGRIASGPSLDQYHDALLKETDRLDALVNRLLDVQQIQAGRRHYAPARVAIAPVVTEAVDRFRSQAAAKNIELRIDVPEPIDLALDRPIMSDAIDNLIDNAIKYSSAGTVVTISARAADGDVRLEVRDQGAGIDRADLPHIFEPYYRGRLGDRESVRGTGLGLALVQAAATAHGGTVDVSSVPGRGSCFSLRLPLGGAP